MNPKRPIDVASSRRFLVLITLILTAIFNDVLKLNISQETISWIAAGCVAAIFGYSGQDWIQAWRGVGTAILETAELLPFTEIVTGLDQDGNPVSETVEMPILAKG